MNPNKEGQKANKNKHKLRSNNKITGKLIIKDFSMINSIRS